MTLPLSYTIASDLRESLRHIDDLRTKVLTTALSPGDEHAFRWEADVARIQGTLALANIKLSRKDIAKTLADRPKHASLLVHGIKHAMDWLGDAWVASSKTVGPSALEELISFVAVGPLSSSKRMIAPSSKPVRQLLEFLENQTEHPVVRAGIALGILSGTIAPPEDPGVAARLLASLFLAKDGLGLRGMSSPEYQWAKESSSYHVALSTIAIEGNLNHWLLFFTQSVEANTANVATEIAIPHRRAGIQLWNLNDRQRAILHLLDDPEVSITNKTVQNRFRVSQITASRDLAKLVTASLLIPHGKGRSVSYTGGLFLG